MNTLKVVLLSVLTSIFSVFFILFLIQTFEKNKESFLDEELEVKYEYEDQKHQAYYDNMIKQAFTSMITYGVTEDKNDLKKAIPYFEIYFNDINYLLLSEEASDEYHNTFQLIKSMQAIFESSDKEEYDKNRMKFIQINRHMESETYFKDIVYEYTEKQLNNTKDIHAKSISDLRGKSEEENYINNN